MTKQLVTQLARLGDIVQTKRLMLSLKNEGELCMLVDKNLVDFARMLYPYAEIFGVDIHNTNASEIFENNLQSFKKLKEQEFDHVYALNHSSFSQRINTLFPEEALRGYGRNASHERHSKWIQLAFRWMKDRRYTPLNLMDFWGYFAPNPVAPQLVNPIAKPQGKGLGIVLAGQNAKRSLCAQDYAKIIHAVYERLQTENNSFSGSLFFFGTNNEKKFSQELINHLPRKFHSQVINLAGKTNLNELMQHLEGLDLLLTPDTGIAHLAAHLGVPVEGFYLSSANCFETGPYGIGHSVWQASTTCSPCTEFQICPHAESNHKDSTSSLPCHQAFQQPALLMRLNINKYTEERLQKQPLMDIIHYTSSFEEYAENASTPSSCIDKNSFGLTWQGKQIESHQRIRSEQRSLLQAYCTAIKPIPMNINPVQNTALFHETDWIFPQNYPNE